MPDLAPLPDQTRLRIGFLLAPRFTLSAFATFVDVLRLAADAGDRRRRAPDASSANFAPAAWVRNPLACPAAPGMIETGRNSGWAASKASALASFSRASIEQVT